MLYLINSCSNTLARSNSLKINCEEITFELKKILFHIKNNNYLEKFA